MKIKRVKCPIGIIGWQGKLHDVYNTYEEFERYCSMLNIHIRVGYETPENAWRANPLIQGSINASDYCKVKANKH